MRPAFESLSPGMTDRPLLADIIDEVSAQLIAGVEQALSPTAVALPLRRTIERLPGLLRDLVEDIGQPRSRHRDPAGASTRAGCRTPMAISASVSRRTDATFQTRAQQRAYRMPRAAA